ncbi:MAG: helix-turn-helix domain-containing protein [Oscillospiraceae bacterium]|nr:helix-turn-helix transcriptional regulator [Oscillospiraceae bacterium]
MKDRIKMLRKALSLTQVEFGNKLGLKGNTITGYENGIRTPSESVILSICREFHVNERWLRTGEGEMFRVPSRDEEIAAFVGDALCGEADNFQRRVLAVLARLSREEWAWLEAKAREIVAESPASQA